MDEEIFFIRHWEIEKGIIKRICAITFCDEKTGKITQETEYKVIPCEEQDCVLTLSENKVFRCASDLLLFLEHVCREKYKIENNLELPF